MEVSTEVYDANIFADKPSEICICPLCFNVIKDPRQCRNGHCFCSKCVENAIQIRQECPICKVDLTVGQLGRNLILQGIIHEMETFCISVVDSNNLDSDHCNWTGLISERISHYNQCEYRIVKCRHNHCTDSFQKRHSTIHETNCPYRTVTCEFCKVEASFVNQEAHGNECEHAVVECPQKCGALVKRLDVNTHSSQFCPLTFISCPLFMLKPCYKCSGTVLRKDLEDHTTSFRRQTYIKSVRDETLRKHSDEISNLMNQIDVLNQRNKRLERSNVSLNIELVEMHEKLKFMAAKDIRGGLSNPKANITNNCKSGNATQIKPSLHYDENESNDEEDEDESVECDEDYEQVNNSLYLLAGFDDDADFRNEVEFKIYELMKLFHVYFNYAHFTTKQLNPKIEFMARVLLNGGEHSTFSESIKFAFENAMRYVENTLSVSFKGEMLSVQVVKHLLESYALELCSFDRNDYIPVTLGSNQQATDVSLERAVQKLIYTFHIANFERTMNKYSPISALASLLTKCTDEYSVHKMMLPTMWYIRDAKVELINGMTCERIWNNVRFAVDTLIKSSKNVREAQQLGTEVEYLNRKGYWVHGHIYSRDNTYQNEYAVENDCGMLVHININSIRIVEGAWVQKVESDECKLNVEVIKRYGKNPPYKYEIRASSYINIRNCKSGRVNTFENLGLRLLCYGENMVA